MPAPKNEPAPKITSTEKPDPTEPKVGPSKPDPHIPTTTRTPEKPLTIAKPSSGGWSKASVRLQELGKNADTAMHQLKNAYCEMDLIVDNAKLKGSITTRASIRDAGTYHIDFRNPDEPEKPHIFLSNAGKKFDQFDNKWIPHTTNKTASKLDGWEASMSEQVVRAIADGANTWEKLLPSLGQDSSSFKADVERQEFQIGGRSVPILRIVATKKSDPSVQWEFKFDDEKHLPITIKFVGKDHSGKANNLQMNLRWAFTRPLDPSLFQLPN